MKWLSSNKIAFVYGADANWGQLPERDLELTRELVRLKKETGFPHTYFVNSAKNATERIYDIAKLLQEAGLAKGATLSMQSWDKNTLTQIKRSNIRLKTYTDLQAKFKSTGTPTYSELIVGLPGETLDSFCAGIDQSIEAGCHDGLVIYPCRVLPGTEMAKPAYRVKHGIVTNMTAILANHTDITSKDIGPVEYEETIVATKTMPHADWLEAQRIAWFVEVFFVLGIARLPLLRLRERGVKVTDFAQWALRCDVLDRARIEAYLASQDRGEPEVPRGGLEAFGNIRWPIDEASWLALMAQKDETYAELLALVEAFCDARGLDKYAVGVQANMARLKHWTDGVSPSDPATFAREVLWFGRRGGSMLRLEVES